MRVLLGFGKAQLAHALAGDILAQALREGLRRKGDGRIQVRGILRQGGEALEAGEGAPLKGAEVRLHEAAGQLPGPVGAKVHEEDSVAVGNGRWLADEGGRNELVRFPPRIGGFQPGFRGVGAMLRFALRQEPPGGGDSVPAVVPVHGVVAAHQAGDAALARRREARLHGGKRSLCRLGRHIPPVQKGMHPEGLHAPRAGQIYQRMQLRLVAVDAAGGQEPQDMQAGALATPALATPALALQRIKQAVQNWIVLEAAIGDGPVNAGEVLIDHPPSAQGRVAHFRVAHLPGRQANIRARAGHQAMGPLRPEGVPAGGAGEGDGIAIRLFPMAPAVKDDKQGGCWRAWHGLSPS